MSNNSIFKLVIILAIVVGLIGGLFSYKYNPMVVENNNNNNNMNSTQNTYVEIMKDVEKPTSRTIVTDKYVSKLDKNSNIVVLDQNGNIISIIKGAVLTGGVVINAQDESYSVYNIDNPEKSVSTE